MLEKRFAEYCKKYNLLSQNDKVILSISGGPDSVALSHLLGRFKQLFKINVILVYFDHGLRSRREIKKDVEIISKIAQIYSWKLVIKKLIIKKSSSIEEISRDLRYKSLLKFAKKYHANKIITAHTADDNAETLLMWLLRGTGIKGLGGIPLKRQLSEGIAIVRPFLFFEKDEIINYLNRNRLKYSLDKTNFECKFFRNKIRNKIIPYLKVYRPSVVRHLNNISCLFTDLNEWIATAGESAYRCSVCNGVLDLTKFFRYNNMIRYEIIRRWLGLPIDFDLFFRINEFLKDKNSLKFSVDKFILRKTFVHKVYKEKQ